MHYLQHRKDLDQLTGDEFIACGEEHFSREFFINHAEETDLEVLLRQQEFKEYGNSLCTIY